MLVELDWDEALGIRWRKGREEYQMGITRECAQGRAENERRLKEALDREHAKDIRIDALMTAHAQSEDMWGKQIRDIEAQLHELRECPPIAVNAADLTFDKMRSLFYDAFAALAINASKPQWRPIETAPRDGTQVIVCRNDGGYIGGAHFVADNWWALEKESHCNPTHWQPLPEPPR